MSMTQTEKPGPATGFTHAEREEIITRLQTVENIAAGISAQLTDLIGELFPMSETTEEEPYGHRVNMVQEVHTFAAKLAAMLDAMAGNPMFAAMLPPEAFE